MCVPVHSDWLLLREANYQLWNLSALQPISTYPLVYGEMLPSLEFPDVVLWKPEIALASTQAGRQTCWPFHEAFKQKDSYLPQCSVLLEDSPKLLFLSSILCQKLSQKPTWLGLDGQGPFF